MRFARSLSLCFAAGALGGLANSALVWFCGESGLTGALGVAIQPVWTLAWLYPRLVWGGLWGLLFLLPIGGSSVVQHGVVVSIAPTAFQLLVSFPRADRGAFGLDLGLLTPVLVFLFNAAWGIVAAWWMRVTRG